MKLLTHTIHRSVLRELFTAFVLGLLTFNFILITEKLLRLTKVFASVGASLADMLKILLLMQPQITVLTTPIALLIAVLVTYGRMGADNELVIMRASGMSFRQISKPVFIFGAACFILTLSASFYAAPHGAKRLRETVSEIISRRAPLAIEEGIFNTAFRGVVLYVNEKTPDGDLKDVFIYDERRKGEPAVLLAREGKISTSGDMNISFDLRDGRIHIAKDNSATVLSFGRYMLSFPFTIGNRPLQSLQELTPPKLLRSVITPTPASEELVSVVDGTSNLWANAAYGTGDYYYLLNSGDYYYLLNLSEELVPGSQPRRVIINGVSTGIARGLPLDFGEWGWGDLDGWGYPTVFVRLNGGADPDSFSENYISYTNIVAAEDATAFDVVDKASNAREEEKPRILLEFHRRLSLPALCLILMVLGPPLSLMAGRSGKLGGLAIGILVFALYYIAVVYTEGQAMAGKIPLWLGAWGPAFVFGVVSVLLFRRASSR
jgi:LPS export ABC transporter permease LptF